METIAIAKLRSNPRLAFRREIVVTRDSGAVAIDWEHLDMDDHVRGGQGVGPMLHPSGLPWQAAATRVALVCP